MNLKVVAALIITILAVEALQQTPIKYDSIKNVVVLVLNKALAAAEDLGRKFNEDLENILINRTKLTKDLSNFITKEAQLLREQIFELIAGLSCNATANGKKVIYCIESEHNKIDKVIEATASNLTNCIATQIDVFLPRLTAIDEEFDYLLSKIQDDVDHLSRCADHEIACLVAFAQATKEAVEEAFGAFKSDIQDIVATIKLIENNVKKCVIMKPFKARVQEMFNDAVACFMAKQ